MSDLTSEPFIATFRRFIVRCGKPALVWSDHGSNFVGAQKDVDELTKFLEDQKAQIAISVLYQSLRNSSQNARRISVVYGNRV